MAGHKNTGEIILVTNKEHPLYDEKRDLYLHPTKGYRSYRKESTSNGDS